MGNVYLMSKVLNRSLDVKSQLSTRLVFVEPSLDDLEQESHGSSRPNEYMDPLHSLRNLINKNISTRDSYHV